MSRLEVSPMMLDVEFHKAVERTQQLRQEFCGTQDFPLAALMRDSEKFIRAWYFEEMIKGDSR